MSRKDVQNPILHCNIDIYMPCLQMWTVSQNPMMKHLRVGIHPCNDVMQVLQPTKGCGEFISAKPKLVSKLLGDNSKAFAAHKPLKFKDFSKTNSICQKKKKPQPKKEL